MFDPTKGCELVLRDGTPVRLRCLVPGDRAALAEAYRRLSPESRFHRFWTRGVEVVGERMLDRVLAQDRWSHLTWAVLDPSRDFPPLGGASWWREAEDPEQAEISTVVMDEDQGRGIGTLLLAVVWLSAFRVGIERLVGYTHPENLRAARWMRHSGGAGEWDGYKLIYRWELARVDELPDTPAAADLAAWLAELAPRFLEGPLSGGASVPHP
jgi:RimJ/RimL family protein N-acetyltransferase